MIIDAHVHLGDILYPGGGRLIRDPGVRKAWLVDPISLSELFLHPFMEKVDYESWIYRLAVRADRARNLTATYRNLSAARARTGVTHCAVEVSL